MTQAEVEAKVQLFDTLLLVKDANGAVNPVTPEQISSLKLDGKAIAASSIVLPGAASSENLIKADVQLTEAGKVVQSGQPMVIFGGNGTYSFVAPKTDKNGLLEIQLKGDSHTYQVLYVSNINKGTFLLDAGKVSGGFNTRGEFKTQQAGGGLFDQLGNIFNNPNGYYALAQFDVAALVNFYQANGGQVTITTKDNQQLVFAANDPNTGTPGTGSADIKQEVTGALQGNLNALLGYVGSWTLESDFLKALVPGGQLTVDFSKTGTDSYRLAANLASGSYAGEGKLVSGGGDASTLNLDVSANGKALSVVVNQVSNNRISIKLTKADGVPELAVMLNQEVFLKRAL